jgi:hypothetical protein
VNKNAIGSNSTTIVFEYSEWSNLVKNHTTGKSFKVFFHDMLSQKLQLECNINCWLVCKSNWLTSRGFGNVWNGTYFCLNKKCNYIYYAKAVRESDTIKCEIKKTGETFHEKVMKKKCFRGKERRIIAGELSMRGISRFADHSNILNKTHELDETPFYQQCADSVTLKQIALESRKQNLVSRDIWIDSIASKGIFEELNESNSHISGFVQKVSMWPYELVLFSDNQVKYLKLNYLNTSHNNPWA